MICNLPNSALMDAVFEPDILYDHGSSLCNNASTPNNHDHIQQHDISPFRFESSMGRAWFCCLPHCDTHKTNLKSLIGYVQRNVVEGPKTQDLALDRQYLPQSLQIPPAKLRSSSLLAPTCTICGPTHPLYHCWALRFLRQWISPRLDD